MTEGALPIEVGLLTRFRAAAPLIQWRDAPTPRASRSKPVVRARIAHLNDEETRVEESGVGKAMTVTVDSGPLGALVLLLEIDRRGRPGALTSQEGSAQSAFAQGAIQARWGVPPAAKGPALPISDLISLARYALA